MKRLLRIFLLLALVLWAQAAWPQQGNTVIIAFTGAPSGSCSTVQIALNAATGEFFDCLTGSWNHVGGAGSGTVTNIATTAPISGGPITTTGTLSCPTCLTTTSNVAMLTSTYTNATTTASNITGLSFAVAASTNYTMTCDLFYQGSATTAGLDATITGPSTPTSVFYSYQASDTLTGIQDSVASAFGAKLVDGTITATTNFSSRVAMGLRNGTNSGTVQVQGSATGAGTVTVQAGSFCRLQ